MLNNLDSSKRLNTQALQSSEVLDLAGREALIMRTIGNRSLADFERHIAQQIADQEQAA